MRHPWALLVLLAVMVSCSSGTGLEKGNLTLTEDLSWAETTLPPSPSDTAGNLGLAGVYSGMIGDRLVVAGGANFPKGLPSAGGPKVWYSDVYTYDRDSGWRCWPGALGKESAYGVTVPFEGGLLLIGGCRAEECLPEIRLLRLDPEGRPSVEEWGSLPMPLSNMAGGAIGSKVYLAGGISSMDSTQKALDVFLSLDLRTRTCKTLPWPDAPPRAFAVGAGT